MQFAKDSFYMALRERLAALNPSRTVTLDGATRPALIVAENELVVPVDPLADAFYLEWGPAHELEHPPHGTALTEMECAISYHTFGTSETGVDRGRTLAALDAELLGICQPQQTAQRDFTQTPSVDLGTRVFWTVPELGAISGSQVDQNAGRGTRLERSARVRVFFFSEVTF